MKGEHTENYVIRRIIYSENERSEWKINGKKAKLEDVKELVARLDIEVENLCNFLPQEKVASFAQLSNQELLEETMSTVGGKTMVTQYKDMCTLGKKEKELHEVNYFRAFGLRGSWCSHAGFMKPK